MPTDHFSSLPKVKDKVKLTAFEDNTFKVAQMIKFLSEKVENNVGKGENAGYQHFLLFPQCFKKISFLRVDKCRNCAVVTS